MNTYFFSSFLCFICLFYYSKQQIISVQNYTNMTGNQIYLFTSDPFVYVSFYNNSTETLYGSFNVYFMSPFNSSLNTKGFWIAIGFGESHMTGADIIMCGILKDLKTSFCSDYEAKGWNLILKATQMVKLTGFSKNDSLSSAWNPYVTYFSFSFSRNIDPNRLAGVLNIPKILSGKEIMIAAYGALSGATPSKHSNQLIGFYSVDGSIINGESITNLGVNGLVNSKANKPKLIEITNLKKPFSQQFSIKLLSNIFQVFIICIIILFG